jgi:magnesium transporter
VIQTFLTEGDPPKPLWIDAIAPAKKELTAVGKTYNLHPALVKDCLEPDHLPKLEVHGTTTFLIIRYYDEKSDPSQDSVQALTRKLAIFLGERFLISVHRRQEAFLDAVRDKNAANCEGIFLQVVLIEMLLAAVETYHKPLEEMEAKIHLAETAILKGQNSGTGWEEVFRIKCRLMTIKRLLWHTLNTVQKFVPHSQQNLPLRQDLAERIESLQFFADSLLDDLTSLLNIQMSLISNRTNEASKVTNDVMKVLTLFSAFFLPLNFIVGLYGMNFHYMPELGFRYGYFAVLGVLVTISIGLYIWFVKKGWLR